MKNTLLAWNNQKDIKKVAAYLQENKLIVGTTDTVLGFFGKPSQEVFESLNKLKGRQDKPYLLLASDTDSIHFYLFPEKSLQVEKLMEVFWPGPLTLILKAQEDIAPYLTSQSGAIAVRIPNHKGILELLRQTGPLFSTSANKAGRPVPETLEQLDSDVFSAVAALIVEQKQETTPSTIIDCSGKKPVLIREGAVSIKEIQKICDLVV